MEGLTLLRDAVGKEKRPLSWTIGPQGVHKGPRPSMRDEKREERTSVKRYPSPDST